MLATGGLVLLEVIGVEQLGGSALPLLPSSWNPLDAAAAAASFDSVGGADAVAVDEAAVDSASADFGLGAIAAADAATDAVAVDVGTADC